MFVLITGEYEVIGCDTKIDVFATKSEAYDAMVSDAKKRALDAGVAEDEFAMYVDNLGDDGGRIDEVVGWQIREIPDSPNPKRNQNTDETIGARTIDYKCAPDQRFRSGEVLSHQATLRWESGKSFECHAPGRIELRIGGTPYEYKAL